MLVTVVWTPVASLSKKDLKLLIHTPPAEEARMRVREILEHPAPCLQAVFRPYVQLLWNEGGDSNASDGKSVNHIDIWYRQGHYERQRGSGRCDGCVDLIDGSVNIMLDAVKSKQTIRA